MYDASHLFDQFGRLFPMIIMRSAMRYKLSTRTPSDITRVDHGDSMVF